MGFTLQFILVTLLLSTCSHALEANRLDSTSNAQVDKNADSSGKHEKVENENKTQESVVNPTDRGNEPKTDSKNKNNNIDKEVSLDVNKSSVKLQKSEPYKKPDGDSKLAFSDIARSIDINKYISNDFHNKNNVYKLPASSDNEKFINSEYEEKHSTPYKNEDYSSSYHSDIFSSELTTPKSVIFDKKFKEAVESVEQKLEEIDHSYEDASGSGSVKLDELSVDQLHEQTKNKDPDTKATLDYINYKNIIHNDTNHKSAKHKDLVMEVGTNLDFQSSYNKTLITDESDDDNKNNTIAKEPAKMIDTAASDHIDTSTIKISPTSTRKTSVTKSQLTSNDSGVALLNNRIEKEIVKPVGSGSLTTRENTPAPSTRRTVDITRRGSVKFSDYAPTTALLSTTPKSFKRRKSNKTEDAQLQENQIVQIQVEAPKSLDAVSSTTQEVAQVNSTLATPTKTTTMTIASVATTLEKIVEVKSTTAGSLSEPGTTTEWFEAVESTTTPTTTLKSDPNPTSTVFEDTVTTVSSTDETTDVPTSTVDSGDDLTTETTTEFTTPQYLSTTEESKRTSKDINFPTTSQKDNLVKYSTETSTESLTTSTTMETTDSATTSPVTTEPTTWESDKSFTTEETTVSTTESTILYTTKPSIDLQPRQKSSTDISIYHIESVNNETTLRPDVFRPDEQYPINTATSSMENTRKSFTTEAEPDNTSDVTNGSTTAADLEGERGSDGPNGGTIAAIVISSIGAVCLILLAGLLVVMRKRQKRFNYGQRCRPVNLDDYSMDNISVCNSVRRKGQMRSSKRSYGNPAFEDPSSASHPLNFQSLSKFSANTEELKLEFEEIPQITARMNEMPEGCDTKNRYANVIPLPETRVYLTPIDGSPNSDYINANYVTGPKNTKKYYIACQAPMQNTVDDFWRMVWEQQCRVIMMLTHLFENGAEKCFDYLPQSEVVDCHRLFGDFQVTLKKREVKDKYIISTLQLKNMVSNCWREVTHFWYIGWPEKGVPAEANSLIAFLIEARSYMKTASIDRKDVTNGNVTNGATKNETNPAVVHCSPGTGRTGVVIACDIAIREFEQTRLVDIPRIVYKIRRDRASSVQTKEQYAFIYKVVSLYAAKLTGGALDSL